MDGCGPDDVGPDELKRNKTWREVRAELSRGVNPKWSGASTRNTRLWKASLERKLAQKIVPGAVNGLLLGVLNFESAWLLQDTATLSQQQQPLQQLLLTVMEWSLPKN